VQAPGQVQQGSGEGSEGSNCLGTFGAEPGQVQQRSGGLWCRASQVQQGSDKGSGEDSRSKAIRLNGFRRRFRGRPGKLWSRARSGSTGLLRRFRRRPGAEPGQVQQGSGEGSGEGVGGFGAEPGQVQQDLRPLN